MRQWDVEVTLVFLKFTPQYYILNHLNVGILNYRGEIKQSISFYVKLVCHKM